MVTDLVGSHGDTPLEALGNLCAFMAWHGLQPVMSTFRHDVMEPAKITDNAGNVIYVFGQTTPLHRMEVRTHSVGPR